MIEDSKVLRANNLPAHCRSPRWLQLGQGLIDIRILIDIHTLPPLIRDIRIGSACALIP